MQNSLNVKDKLWILIPPVPEVSLSQMVCDLKGAYVNLL